MTIYLQVCSTPEGNFETIAHPWDMVCINHDDKRIALSADRSHRLPSCKTQLTLNDAVTGLQNCTDCHQGQYKGDSVKGYAPESSG